MLAQNTPPSDHRQTDGAPSAGNAPTALPALALPKGGGAVRSMGEKFAANPVTGTGSMTVPISTSPGRAGFGPQLTLAYDSGAGNGLFGFGWTLSTVTITRKTDKGLPQYDDAAESDVFILSGAEDLVPEFKKDAAGAWVLQDGQPIPYDQPRTVDGIAYTVRRYRPRIEGLFARIERWTNATTGEIHWRSITRDNITTLYGKDNRSRIFDPADADPAHPTRIFSWLICESYDDKGNAILYQYAAENDRLVDRSQANERNRERTANRYLKRILYGNRVSRLLQPDLANAEWLFEVVFDYGEHAALAPLPQDDQALDQAGNVKNPWHCRLDPFSAYRAGFEVRSYRLCRRVLMFHHFEAEAGVGNNCLVRSTDFTYSDVQNPADARNPIYTFLQAATQTGYRRSNDGYQARSMPPAEFEYSVPVIQDRVEEVDPTSLDNLPMGVDGTTYQWTDLHGEGIPGILSEQAGGWFYQRNISPISARPVEFAALEQVAAKPNLALAGGQAQFMDLAGDGLPDLVVFDGAAPGLYEHDDDEGWQPFRPFTARLNRNTRDPNLKFVDLDGDGHADVLITEDQALVWHPSLAEDGFGAARRVAPALDEERGPQLVFADAALSIYLADLSGDGLTDLVRIRNGEVCYWPNLGYGRFGPKVAMDNAPLFDNLDQFDPKRIRLADIDGSGTTDMLYLHRDGVRLYFNQSGNGWSAPQPLTCAPAINDVVAITTADLLGNGTACLVWSSPLPGDARRQMRYVNLIGDQKPHLLIKSVNNLGAETRVTYAPSTKFYLQDKRAGTPWITRLPFPVHVVERVETIDASSGNRFVTRYAYHHGYFDGEEREFRGFGMVEQFDTEQFAILTAHGALPVATNLDAGSHVPPVLTRTWFHTGAYLGREHIADFFAGLLDAEDTGEYYRELGLTDTQARALLLPDTLLPPGLTAEEERQACRALKGAMLRQEIYAQDGSAKAASPYSVAEQNFTIRPVQPQAGNRYAVFFTHPREALMYHYERNPTDPRITHTLTLAVDDYGNVLRSLAIGYGRRAAATDPALTADDTAKQTQLKITVTENRFTNAIDDALTFADAYRAPLPAETQTFELTGFKPADAAARFSFDEWARDDFALLASATEIAYEQTADGITTQKRLIERARTRYRADDLSALLPLGAVEPLALRGESYKLALTPGLLAQMFKRPRAGQPDEDLVPDPATLLAGQGADQGGYVAIDGGWWIPVGRIFYSDYPNHSAAQELAAAQAHFFLPRRYRDAFGHDARVSYDGPADPNASRYDLLIVETRDALGNTVIATNDYRVLQPRLVRDANGNRTAAAFDTLGMLVATAAMDKEGENVGDLLEDIDPDPPLAALQAFVADPHAQAAALLGKATARIVYDLARYQRIGQPPFAASLARETHVSDPLPAGGLKLQVSFSYSDGFGREIQKKIQAEAGAAPQRQVPVALSSGDIRPGELVRDAQGQLVPANTTSRWVGSGRTVFNNKGKPARQYEPFFSATHLYEPERDMTDSGVSPLLCYDPAERVVATLHPNHTYEKVVFDAWQQTTYDVNDTVLLVPSSDDDVKGFFVNPDGTPRIPADAYLPTWHAARIGNPAGDAERDAAQKAAAYADTPTVAHFDALGRPFLTIADHGPNPAQPDTHLRFATRVELDIEGNQRAVRDERKQDDGTLEQRIVMRYAYDMLGNRIDQTSMEAGARWTLKDVTGNPIRAWDSRGHTFRSAYDPLRRPLRTFVTGADPANPNQELLTERLVYGEQHPEADLRNLRGKLYLHLDQAGVATTEAHDFKGNPLRATRRLAREYQQAISWSAIDAALSAATPLDPAALAAALAPLLEIDTFTSRTFYDALNRPVQEIAPRSDQPGAQRNIIQPVYSAANLLEQVHVWLDHPSEPAGLLDAATLPPAPVGVDNIDYDAKGQRQRIDYKNGVSSFYDYDPATFRLTHLFTARNSIAFPGDCPQPPSAGWPGCQVQNLHYTYDPIGNITRIRDDAQQIVYFRNRRVEPTADYTYDALYRLIEATGREHLGQAGGQPNAPTPPDAFNSFHTGLDHPGDGTAMGTYREQYVYDAVGNFLSMRHRGSDPAHPGWTRSYAYNETSLIEDGTAGTLLKTSNRLSSTTIGSNNPITERYVYDAHGNMVRMPHLGGAHPTPNMHWDYRDQLHQTDQGGGGTAYYTYDAAGQRVRKVWEKSANLIEERIYLGGFEIYRRRQGAQRLERETLHIMDDQQRIALVETRTLDSAGDDLAPAQLIRYQFGNHLGSASLELDAQARVISYEEYTPYGSTAYQAVDQSIKAAAKRYRYTSKERDEESGLYYHGARYYAPWLGRWTSADPIEIADGLNVYGYVKCSPINHIDSDGHQSRKITIENEVVVLDQAGGIKYAKKTREEGKIDESGKLKISKKSSRDLTKAEKEQAKAHMEVLKKEMKEKVEKEKAIEEKKEKEKATKPEDEKKYTLSISINVSSVDKKGDVQVTGGPDGNPGHTFVTLKDPDGKIVKILSYGPVKGSGIASIGCSAPGNASYHLLKDDEFNTYEWDITKAQYDKALTKIEDIEKTPGTYSGTNQCTTVALEVSDAAGLA